MEKFKKVTLEDYPLLCKYINGNFYRSCDYTPGSLVLWADVYAIHYIITADCLIIRHGKFPEYQFSFPMGKGDLATAYEWLFSYCRQLNIPFRSNMMEPEMFDAFSRLYPDQYDIQYIRDNADYIYKMEDLRDLPGRRYHGKKNHINKFLRTYPNWRYAPMSDENLTECMKMAKEWCLQNGCQDDTGKQTELCALLKAITHRKELHLTGGVLYIDSTLVALTLGEPYGSDSFVVHFEKAFSSIPGAYPMINQQFVQNALKPYSYINREEDMGVEGLRKAKLSYYPVMLVQKGSLYIKHSSIN